MKRPPFSRLFLIVASTLMAGLLLVTYVPIPYTVRDQFDNNSVLFRVDRRFLFQLGDCVYVNWQVLGPPSLEVDGSGAIGVHEKEVCSEDLYTPRLKVNLADGSSRFYEIPMTYLLLQPFVWLTVFGIVFFALAAVYAFIEEQAYPKDTPRPHIIYRVAKNIFITFVFIGLTLLLLELGVRAYMNRFATPKMKAQYVLSSDELLNQSGAQQTLRPVPLLTYLPEFQHLNNLGYRDEDDTEIPKPADTFRIAALGGSTTYGTGTASAAEAYPAQLEHILEEDYGYINVDVVNAGVPTWNTWNSVSNLAFRVLEVEPDLLLIFHGINDTFARSVSPECYHRESPYYGLPPNWGFFRQQGFNYGSSTLYRFLGVNTGQLPDPTGQALGIEVQLTRPICRNDELDVERLTGVENNPPHFFERNMRSMIGIARIHEINVMLSTWTYFELESYAELAVAQHNAITEALADQYNLPFYDLHQNLPRDPALWTDDLQHMNAAGNLVQAQLYAQYIHEAGLIPATNASAVSSSG